jgi:hypothetical protein
MFLLLNVVQVDVFQYSQFNVTTATTKKAMTCVWDDISLIYPDQYHTPEQVIEELNLIATTAPEIVEMSVLGQSFQGRDIHLMKITNEQNTIPKAGVFIIAQHHAREQITVEVALRFMHQLINNYGTSNVITSYVDSLEIFIIPTINPDGLHYVVGNDTLVGDPWLRKNLRAIDDDNDSYIDEDPYDDLNEDGIISGFDVFLKHPGYESEFLYSYYEGNDTDEDGLINEDLIGGVDLNRNYGYRWNDSSLSTGSTSDSLSDVYPGLEAFSEPETQIVRDFTSEHSFSMAMSLHSGINTTYFPWASGTTWSEPDRYSDIYNDLVSILPDYFFQDYINEEITFTKKLSSYTSAGEWGDWMYTARKCQVPVTFEIFHEKGSDEYQPIPVEDTETHETWQFDTVESYFAPQEEKIEALWNDISPAVYYWLATTPQLEISEVAITGENSVGSTLTIEAKVKNTSPRVTTIEEVKVVFDDFTPLTSEGSPITISTINEKYKADVQFNLVLDAQIEQGNNITIFIGNHFVGYYPLVVESDLINKSQGIPVDILGIIAVVPLLYIIRRKKFNI